MNLKKKTLIIALIIIICFLIICHKLNKEIINNYLTNESIQILDRKGVLLFKKTNNKEYYSQYLNFSPSRFENLLLQKEDKYFYWHKGFNPISIIKALGDKLGFMSREGSSTISQQLTKILLNKETERNWKNKLIESVYVASLELNNSKEKIMTMYINSVFLGNQLQGLESASQGYFNTSSGLLTTEQCLQLLATINSPSNDNPLSESNIEKAKIIGQNLKLDFEEQNFIDSKQTKINLSNYFEKNKNVFELTNYLNSTNNSTKTTIDKDINEQIRNIVKNNIDFLQLKKAKNAAVVVMLLPENEIVSVIGSPDPKLYQDGYQINMAEQPRQIGSTIKPFIYLKGFENGMRPYTLIDDREYKYLINSYYPFYPQNYDFTYRGEITAHYALSNSINVPALKTLEFVGLSNFQSFLINDLEFEPPQNINQYQLGIAMGTLEMDLLHLSQYFSIFPNKGNLKNIKLFEKNDINNTYFKTLNKKISEESYIQLINKILNDRKTGMDQFGMVSSLNIPFKNYALKTGTSHDFKDSWIIGYTPDFLVGVWVGNADQSATDGISGQKGAGNIWRDIMELMYNSEYNYDSSFDFSLIADYQTSDGLEWGLLGDNFEEAQNIIQKNDDTLIINPHDGDVFLYEDSSSILLKAKEDCSWEINDQYLGTGKELFFEPEKGGEYKIQASSSNQVETITILFKDYLTSK
ncbi:MAG: transglycosylase domain-containing protein [Candidatus Pacebacteria bacterium]|nr:transglycosylase domain-containing protein [Candidatus Paceibacterota bacterium]